VVAHPVVSRLPSVRHRSSSNERSASAWISAVQASRFGLPVGPTVETSVMQRRRWSQKTEPSPLARRLRLAGDCERSDPAVRDRSFRSERLVEKCRQDSGVIGFQLSRGPARRPGGTP